MVYFNYIDNATLYPTPTTPGESGAYPSLGQVSANEEWNVWQTFDQSAGGWNTGGQPGCAAGGPTSIQAEASFGKDNPNPLTDRRLTCGYPVSESSATLHPTQTYGCWQPPYPEYCEPTGDLYAQSHYSGAADWDNSFADAMALQAPAVLPTPGGCEYLFFSFETLSDRVLTDHEQSRSTTGGRIRAGNSPVGSTW